MKSRLWTLLGAMVLAATAACNDSLRPEASFAVSYDTAEVFAVNGSPREAPAALNFFLVSPVPVTGAFNFDIAFDIDAQGRALLYPVQLIASFGTGKSVGIRKMEPGSFDAIEKAPLGSYVRDSATVVQPGSVVVVEVANSGCAYFAPNYYGKLVVDSIRPAERRLFVRFAGNPNCGYLSLKPGNPRE